MMNTAIFKTLLDRYNATAYTHKYIMGFTDRHNVYACFCEADMLPFVCTLDKVASNRKGGYSLRFKPTKAQKEALKVDESFILCSEAYMEEQFSQSKYNRGEIFEKLITEHFGQEWVKDNIPYTEAGDIEVDGIAYQIKFQKATFCNESILAQDGLLYEKSLKTLLTISNLYDILITTTKEEN